MFYIHKINEITTVTFEKTVFQRKLIFKEMKGIDGFYKISRTQVKMNFFILCLGIFDFMKINFLSCLYIKRQNMRIKQILSLLY